MEKENEKTVITIRAFKCHDCQTISESPVTYCQQRKHNISMVNTQKRWFECVSCRQRETVVGSSKTPSKMCKCGKYSWKPCGKYGSGLTNSNTLVDGSKLIFAASWDSSHSDMISIGDINGNHK